MQDRVRTLKDGPPRPGARYVLYWAQRNRRVDMNHGLILAADWANRLELPLLYFEELDCAYRHGNDRLYTFLLEGVPDTQEHLTQLQIGYAFHLRRRRSEPESPRRQLVKDAAVVVSDDDARRTLEPRMQSLADESGVPFYVVDSRTVIPMSRFDKQEWAAYTMRPKARRMLPQYLAPAELPKVRRPYRGPAPEWHTTVRRENIPQLVSECEIDHSVQPSRTFTGGAVEARRRLAQFLQQKFQQYGQDRNQPSRHATSNMSPYLHFGQISPLEIAVTVKQHAEERRIPADEHLEELIVRRELAHNFTRFSPRPDSLESLPAWAQATLRQHANDERPVVYSAEQLEFAQTGDDIWNAAQKELLLRGKIHGYYRMYWGKKVIEWSRTHEEALETLLYFHDRYALDGRDPNTYANILWLFGLHDRPWGERPIFGKVRYLSYDGMRRKTDSAAYIDEVRDLERGGADPLRV